MEPLSHWDYDPEIDGPPDQPSDNTAFAYSVEEMDTNPELWDLFFDTVTLYANTHLS